MIEPFILVDGAHTSYNLSAFFYDLSISCLCGQVVGGQYLPPHHLREKDDGDNDMVVTGVSGVLVPVLL